MRRNARVEWVAVVTGLVAVIVSCDRTAVDPVKPSPRSAPSAFNATRAFAGSEPIDVVRRAHSLRLTRQWLDLENLIVPEQRRCASELVRATDALLEANEHLRRVVVREHGFAAWLPFDRSAAGNAIGVFSVDVRALAQRIEDDRAKVTIQVADRVPVEQVELVRRGDRWLIRTDPPIESVAKQIRRLASVPHATAARVERMHLSVSDIERELEAQQAPALRRLAQLELGHP